MPRDMKVAQTSRNKKLYNWLYEYQPGGNAAVPVSTKLILTFMLLTSYSNIPGFLRNLVRMPRYIMKPGWGPFVPGVAFQSHLCWQQRKTRVELFYSWNIHTLSFSLIVHQFGNFIANPHYIPNLDCNIFKWIGGKYTVFK